MPNRGQGSEWDGPPEQYLLRRSYRACICAPFQGPQHVSCLLSELQTSLRKDDVSILLVLALWDPIVLDIGLLRPRPQLVCASKAESG